MKYIFRYIGYTLVRICYFIYNAAPFPESFKEFSDGLDGISDDDDYC